MGNTIISSERLSRQFKVGSVTINALNKVNFIVKKNEFVALMGASGSGKSTIMNLKKSREFKYGFREFN